MPESTLFGKNVFNDSTMRERLPKITYEAIRHTIDHGGDIEKGTASVIAAAMKDWAIEHGATHYTHWFQPMTGKTAEKHDSFISPISDGRAIMEFSGKELARGESDASSFPSGGLRETSEARGYVVWDCTSPAFLKEDASGITLCIPSVYYSHKQEALDKKTPLLRSMIAIEKQALRIVRLFGNTTSERVFANAGAEQEYFLVDRKHYDGRIDLKLTGRTLFGRRSPKGQELDDHYYGTIKDRVAKYMLEVDKELWKVGVPAKTKHNEVAPAQHELAPLYATGNIATDHNQIVMDVLQKVALRHDMVCLLHEKPFDYINGSGKHNNWSLITDDGINLIEPGKTPHENKQFLVFLMAVVGAVSEYAPLIRLSAANAGNDFRLGASEAPPAIISIFLGEQLTDIIEQIAEGKEELNAKEITKFDIGIQTLPTVSKATTDRNRTSPFAFTGNKFEFRMVGSSQSIAKANFIMNTVVAEYLCRMADELEQSDNMELTVRNILTDMIKKHKNIIFNGDGYAEGWKEEAAKRGLPNIDNAVDAFSMYTRPQYIALFERHNVLNAAEISSRQSILYEEYYKLISVEASTMIQMTRTQIIPAIIDFTAKMARVMKDIQHVGMRTRPDTSVHERLLLQGTELLTVIDKGIHKLEVAVSKIALAADEYEKSVVCRDVVLPAMKSLRAPCDELEEIMPAELWPLPSYIDLLFGV